MQEQFKYLSKIAEPITNGCFNPSNLAEELACLGVSLQDNLSPTDIEEHYFKGRTDGYHTDEHEHFACALSNNRNYSV